LLSAAGNYSIKVFNPNDALLLTEEVTIALQKNAAGKYYCPMFCEDDKVYDRRLSCLVVWTWYKHSDHQRKQCTPAPCILKLSRKGGPVPAAEWISMEPTESEDNKAFLTYA
jgi:Cu2+-exporting ATPase